MDMRFGMWDVRNLYRAGLFMTVANEISKYKLDLVGVQEVRWDRGGTEPAGTYIFFYGKGNVYRLCGLVVRVSGYRSRGPGFDCRPYQFF
jgi:hypothetical protein